MNIIQVEHLRKVFQVPHKDPGLRGAFKALFVPKYDDKVAVDDISFSIQPGEVLGLIRSHQSKP